MKRLLTLFVLIVCSLLSYGQDVTIGTGTSVSKFPLGNFYGYERSAALYTANEVNRTGFINQIAWNIGKTGGARPIKIYLKEVTSSTLSAANWDTFTQGATLVFDGVLNPTATGFITFPFDVSFNYTGGNNNLLVLVEANYGGSGNGEGSAGLDVSATSISAMHFGHSKDTTPDNTANLSAQSTRPNVKITFGNQITCFKVNGLVTTSIKDDSIIVSWNAAIGSSSYDVYISTSSTAPSGTTSGVNTSSTTHTFQNLTSNTQYYIWIRSSCSSSEKSFWSSPLIVRTACSVFTLPFSEGFELGSTSLPCWTIVDGNGDASGASHVWKELSGATNAASGTYSMRFYSYKSGGNDHDDWLISPTFKFAAGKLYKLSYKYKTSTSYDNEFEVRLSKNGVSTSSFQTVLLSAQKRNLGSYVEEIIFIQGSGDDVNFAWVVLPTTENYTYVYLDDIIVEEVDCAHPIQLSSANETQTSANLSWVDNINTSWEYWVQKAGNGVPTSTGTISTVKTVTVTQEQNGTPLKAITNYEFYVRAKCSGADSDWIGPFRFGTACGVVTDSFFEDFEEHSASVNCWTIVDNNNDGTATNNQFRINTGTTAYEGARFMYFYASSTSAQSDDWLISPTFSVSTGKTYKLKYYYRTTSSYDNEFEVLYSTNGVAIGNFVNVLVPKTKTNSTIYQEKEVFITGVNGTLNIAWHVETRGYAYLYLDAISFEEVECASPIDIKLDSATATSADISWTDVNSSWEYYVLPVGSTPPSDSASGTSTTSKNVTVTRTNTNVNFEASQAYDFYVRAKCSNGNFTEWKHFEFYTGCGVINRPFFEGFNVGSPTMDCWTIVDANGDSTGPTSNIWRTSTTNHEGGQSMYFYGGASGNDDWLISPPLRVSANKTYMLKYYYRTSTSYTNDYEVLLSDSGTALANFTKVIRPLRSFNSSTFEEVVYFITGVSGDINLAWRVKTTGYAYGYLDAVTFEETDCAYPLDLDVIGTTATSATLKWNDVGNTAWEYVVQIPGGGQPTTSGIATQVDSPVATLDSSGNQLVPDTEYEYYVRAVCSSSTFSDWRGPFKFRTQCLPFTAPFSESFDTSSISFNCWNIIDVNKDATSPTGNNIWKTTTTAHAGGRAMYFYGASGITHDDWLISPTINLTGGFYKVSYYYRGTATNMNSIEVMYSTTGNQISSFVHTGLPETRYSNTGYVEENFFIKGPASINVGFHVVSQDITNIYIDSFKIERVDCPDPTQLSVTNVKSDSATIQWVDDLNTDWEYYVQEEGIGLPPTTGGVPTTNKSINITQDSQGNNLSPSTLYEFYVRSDCGDGDYGDWVGPFQFATPCAPVPLPYAEDFELVSSLDCWTIIDNNNDSTSPTSSNIWRRYSSTAYANSGTHSLYFYGTTKQHDDWAISPTFTFDSTKKYRLSYYHRATTTSSYDNKYSVRLSTEGTDISKFTTILTPSTKYNNGVHEKREIYIEGIGGEVNIAWVADGVTTGYIAIDDISIVETDCIAPKEEDVNLGIVTFNSATISWVDNEPSNTSYNYFVQPTGLPAPTGGGLTTTNKSVSVLTSNGPGGGALLPDTEYDFYVRSSCGTGKYSLWVGPIKFRTLCAAQLIPFWEGFNTNSTTMNCWTIIDNNNDATSATSSGIWKTSTVNYEGGRSMYFYGTSSTRENDDWLISPTFNLVAGKFYRLKYHKRGYSSTSTIEYYKPEYTVYTSNSGVGISSFTETVIPKQKIENGLDWSEEDVIIRGYNGTINFAWHVTSVGYSYLYLDNIFLEEVACPEPGQLGVRDEKPDSVTLTWEEMFDGTQWEYYVQKDGMAAPANNATGVIVTTQQAVNVGVEANGAPLVNNSAYEFYVRTVCGPNNTSVWVGPFKFMTACGVFNPPFSESFESSSLSVRCWEVLDGNNDAVSPTSNNIWKASDEAYIGRGGYEFIGSSNVNHNDWLISPTVKLDGAKIYRLKYYYRTTGASTVNNEFEVLSSINGTGAASFTNVLKPKKVYNTNGAWIEEKMFIQGITGDVNIAIHVVTDGQSSIYFDEFSLEEVLTCPEPLGLDVNNVTHNSGTILWTDNFGADRWEYFVQRSGGKAPGRNEKGIATKDKSVVVTRDNVTKQALASNTEYEFYVRTNCGDGTFSIWAGPFKFTTLCGVYDAPFFESFDKESKYVNCWSAFDVSRDAANGINVWTISGANPFEGDGHASFSGNANITHDDWLISPDINLDGGLYVLKYRYRASNADNDFEVKLSNSGTAINSFTTTLVASKVYKNVTYKEEVVFFNGTQGISNFGFHVKSQGVTSIMLDNFELKKVVNCAEPNNVEMINSTGNSIDVKWLQYGNVNNWEVVLVPYGDPAPTNPTNVHRVTGQPQTTIPNVVGGTVYTVYVRSICSVEDGTYSDWSTGVMVYTKVGANDECTGAIKVEASNDLDTCDNIFKGVTLGGTKSNVPRPSCYPTTFDSSANAMDIWFEFTPQNAINVFKIQNVINLTTGNPQTQTFYFAIYEVDCNAVATTATKWCFSLASTNAVGNTIRDMIPGRKYLIRMGYVPTGTDRHMYDLCIGSHNGKYLEVYPSGTKYTVDELVKDVLVRSNCDLVSNVRYQNSDGNSSAQAINTIAYFNKGETDFPFDDGIVLVTDNSSHVPGPYGDSSRGNNTNRWSGDKDLIDAVNDAGGWPSTSSTVRSTILEFDFIPIKEVLQFEYLFASNSYAKGCTNVRCEAGALFAAWLIDIETGIGKNLAKINGTDTPIALNTVINNEWAQKTSGGLCPTNNPDLYWRHYENNIHNPLGAHINFVGMTKAMQSDETFVVPGRKYKIKLAVLDFCTNAPHTSAAFFKAGSFDLGDLDLGRDLTVDNDNAICGGESKTIQSGLGEENVVISWYKDGVLIPNETKPELEVTETGTYKVIGKYEEINCEVKGEIFAEIYPAISTVVDLPKDIDICRFNLKDHTVNLAEIQNEMFKNVNEPQNYFVEFYETEDDALFSSDEIIDLENYIVDFDGELSVKRFVKVEDIRTGCIEIFEFTINKLEGEIPSKPADVVVCDSYVLPELEPNQHYYLGSKAEGQEYFAGDILGPGEYVMYVLKDNGDDCYEEVSFDIKVTEFVKAKVFEDVHYECELYTLEELPEHNKYFMEVDGTRIQLLPGIEITTTGTTIYVVAETPDKVCYDESSFTINYNDCPIPKGFSPNGDGINDTFDLSKHGVTSIKVYNRAGIEVYSHGIGYTNQWYGQDKKGKELPSGTYYYVIQAFEKTRTGWVQINK